MPTFGDPSWEPSCEYTIVTVSSVALHVAVTLPVVPVSPTGVSRLVARHGAATVPEPCTVEPLVWLLGAGRTESLSCQWLTQSFLTLSREESMSRSVNDRFLTGWENVMVSVWVVSSLLFSECSNNRLVAPPIGPVERTPLFAAPVSPVAVTVAVSPATVVTRTLPSRFPLDWLVQASLPVCTVQPEVAALAGAATARATTGTLQAAPRVTARRPTMRGWSWSWACGMCPPGHEKAVSPEKTGGPPAQ